MIRLSYLVALSLFLSACSAQADTAPSACQSALVDRTAITSHAENGFSQLSETGRDRLASQLADCLGHSDPTIRDTLAYGTLTQLLRSGTMPEQALRELRDTLLADLDKKDPDGFRHAFVALVLAEVSRTDRVSSYLSDEERTALVSRAAHYITQVRDYRGFSDTDGWRHGVAHGADWLMQLALNPNLTDDGREMIYAAVASQVQAHDGHAYIFGEAERLARPFLFAAMGETAEEPVWTERFEAITSPAPLESWSEAYGSEADLARLHNLKSFLRVLYINVSLSQNDALKTMQPVILNALRQLPT